MERERRTEGERGSKGVSEREREREGEGGMAADRDESC